MYTYFIRHTEDFGVIEEAVEKLWNENKIAIHFPGVSPSSDVPDSSSINPGDYKKRSHKSALSCFRELNEKGGYIWAEYRNKEDIKIGKIIPQSFKILKTKWREYDRTAIIKTLQMEQVRVLKSRNAIFLKACRPIQGTICRWHNAVGKLDALVEGRPFEMKIENLTPSQQETVCAEYLRKQHNKMIPVLEHLLLPVGRTLKDIDIYGFTRSGKELFAQVTNYSFENKGINEKIQSLLDYSSKETELVLFCNHENIETKEGYIVIPLSVVERWLLSNTKFSKFLFNF